MKHCRETPNQHLTIFKRKNMTKKIYQIQIALKIGLSTL